MYGRGSTGSYSGTVGGATYSALWQVVVLDRKTLGLVSNHTYGRCSLSGARYLPDYACGDDGSGRFPGVELAEQLAALDEEKLVIAVSHPSGGAGRAWATPEEPFEGTTR